MSDRARSAKSPRRFSCLLFATLWACGYGVSTSRAQDAKPSDADAKASATTAKKKARPSTKSRRTRAYPPGTYMGRPIADVMSWEGAEWLVRETREQEEQPDAMLDALKIPVGAVVADVGAGVGYNSLRMSRRVGPKGVVYATDVQPQMLQMLRAKMKEAGVANVRPIRSTPGDPKLPENALDLILMVDVYHEFSEPDVMLQGLRRALKPGGRIVFVEFRAEDPDVPIKPEHKMTLAQVKREVVPQGFVFQNSLEFLPWQHIIVFEKPKSETEPKPASASPPLGAPIKEPKKAG